LKLIGKAPRGALFVFVALALGCMIAACGSSSGSTTSGSSGSSGSSSSTTASAAAGGSGPNSAQRAKLAACLKQHGVTLPSRPAGAPPGGASGSGSASGTGTTGTSTTRRRGFFGGGGAFANNPKLQAAFKACGANFGFRGGGGRFTGRLSHTVINKYVTCVRQHGYNLPAPNFSGKGSVFPANIRSNAKFQAASRACQSILAPPGGGAGGGTSTNSGA